MQLSHTERVISCITENKKPNEQLNSSKCSSQLLHRCHNSIVLQQLLRIFNNHSQIAILLNKGLKKQDKKHRLFCYTLTAIIITTMFKIALRICWFGGISDSMRREYVFGDKEIIIKKPDPLSFINEWEILTNKHFDYPWVGQWGMAMNIRFENLDRKGWRAETPRIEAV